MPNTPMPANAAANIVLTSCAHNTATIDVLTQYSNTKQQIHAYTSTHDWSLSGDGNSVSRRTIEGEPAHPKDDGTKERHRLMVPVNRDELAVLHAVETRAQNERTLTITEISTSNRPLFRSPHAKGDETITNRETNHASCDVDNRAA
jgi:hypothetical protein